MRKKKHPKIHQIRTPVSFDKTVFAIERVLNNMGIPREDIRIATDSFTGRVGLAFKHNDVHYFIVSEKQTDSRNRPSLKDNARAIYHLIHARELEMRKGIETIESAFSGFVDWLSTPKLPDKMAEAFEQRGYHPELPPPKTEPQQILYTQEGP